MVRRRNMGMYHTLYPLQISLDPRLERDEYIIAEFICKENACCVHLLLAAVSKKKWMVDVLHHAEMMLKEYSTIPACLQHTHRYYSMIYIVCRTRRPPNKCLVGPEKLTKAATLYTLWR